MAETVFAALSLGGNRGDVVDAFVHALSALRDGGDGRLSAVSSVYRTPPWGKTDQPDFFNIAALLETRREAHALLADCLALEAECGRVRREKWASRTLDIDIIDYGGATIDDDALHLPHKHAHERAFVLIPLREIAPRLMLGARPVAEWASFCDATGVLPDQSATKRLRDGLAHQEV